MIVKYWLCKWHNVYEHMEKWYFIMCVFFWHTIHEMNQLCGDCVRVSNSPIPKLLDAFRLGEGKVFPILNYVIKHYTMEV
jgi:hypothetical protein